MKRFFKLLLYVFGAIIIVVAALLIYVKTALPSVGDPPDIKVEITPEQIERGKYLANHVMVCMDCHSTRDWSLFSAPPLAGTEGKGGDLFNQNLGFPGKYISSNITPYSLGDWTDGEIFRAITTGVSKDGHALFPIMPYLNFGKLDQEDIYAVIAYMRTLEPIENKLEQSESDFPMNFIINTIPQKAEFNPLPPTEDIANYGKYLVTAAGCYGCHTKQEISEDFASGNEFKFPDGSVVSSSNLTPHPNTGIGNWTKEQFVNRFKLYTDTSYTPEKVNQGEFQTVMPWIMYAGMTTEDLEVIYEYLKSVKPVDIFVDRFTPPLR